MSQHRNAPRRPALPFHVLFDTTAALAILGLAVHWVIERARLRAFVGRLGPLPSGAGEKVLFLAGQFANRQHRSSDPPYMFAFLGPLGATAGDVIRHGGCCSGTARLYMLTLGAVGIRANQITVYHRSGKAQHCLVEVHLARQVMIADPMYGVFYTDASGTLLGLQELQSGAIVECRPAAGAVHPGYPEDNYYDFNFALTKTANWTKSWQRRVSYSILRRITNGGVDRLRVPQLLEWPQVLLGLALVGVWVTVHALVLLSQWVSAT